MSELDRINKYLAHAGIGSRRQCDEMVKAGRITLDGIRVESLATKVAPGQVVAIDGKPVAQEEIVYWLVNKPQGHLCTNHDPSGRPLAVDLVDHVPQRVYTVGRLDEDSEGLLLLTNDGDLAFRLTHPSYCVEKTYEVQVAGHPTPEQLAQLTDGIWLSDGKARASHVKVMEAQGESTWLKIVLAEGKNREIRRMLAKVGHKVLALKRVAIGPIWLDRLPKGKSRRLKPHEIEELRLAAENARKEHNRNRDQEERPPRNEISEDLLPKGRAPRVNDRMDDRGPPRGRPEGRFGDRGAGGPPRGRFAGAGGPPRGRSEGRFEDRGPGGPPRGRFEDRGPGGPPRGRFEDRGPGGPPRGRFEDRGPGGPPRGRFGGGPGGPPRGRFEDRGPGPGFQEGFEDGPMEDFGFGGRGRSGPPKADPLARQKGKDQRKGGKPAFRRKPSSDEEAKG